MSYGYDPDDPTICHSCYETLEVCWHYTHMNAGKPVVDDCVICKQQDEDDE